MTHDPHSNEEAMEYESMQAEKQLENEPAIDNSALGGESTMGEAAREKIHRDIADRIARRKAAQENSLSAQGARLRFEIARRIADVVLPNPD